MKNALVVVPAYNEQETIKLVVERALRYADVCVIDDGSQDSTAAIVAAIPDAVCINHRKNTHIPGAILDGMRYAARRQYNYVVTMDAGLSHSPDELPSILNAPDSDMVIGVRTREVNKPLYRKLLSKVGTFMINLALRHFDRRLAPARFCDLTSGYRRYSRKAVELLLGKRFIARSFDFHIEALMFLYRNGMDISEVPISYNFSNSSLNFKVIFDAVLMLFDLFLAYRK